MPWRGCRRTQCSRRRRSCVTSSYRMSHHHTECHVIIHSVTSSYSVLDTSSILGTWSTVSHPHTVQSVTSSYTVSHHHTQCSTRRRSWVHGVQCHILIQYRVSRHHTQCHIIIHMRLVKLHMHIIIHVCA